MTIDTSPLDLATPEPPTALGRALTVLEGMEVYNETDIPDEDLRDTAELREVAVAMNRFVTSSRRTAHESGMFDRKAYSPPAHVYDERVAARHAVEYDDVVGALMDAATAVAIRKVRIECDDPAEQQIWDKYAEDINLTGFMRNAFRTYRTDSEVDILKDWARRSYKVDNVHGNSRYANCDFLAPDVRILNSLHVVPFDLTPARGTDRLAWYANTQMVQKYRSLLQGQLIDPRMERFYLNFVDPASLFVDEVAALVNLGVSPSNLIELNPYFAFRATDERADWERHAPVRLKRLFALLDLKQQQIAKDRAHLIGSANYILVLRKGSEKHPGTPAEREDLRRNYKYLAKQPIIISDHRLDVSLVAPPQEFVLDSGRYEGLNQQIASAFWGVFATAKIPGSAKANLTMMAAGLERDRDNLARAFEKNVVEAIRSHPLNVGKFTANPRVVFTPRKVEIEKDAQTLQVLTTLYEQRGFSLTSLLDQMGFDINVEAARKRNDANYEAEFPEYIPYDYVEQVSGKDSPGTAAPAASGAPARETPRQSGRRGGRPAGQPAKPTKVRDVTETGHPSTKKGVRS